MINRVILMGRLTADPELRQTPSGIASCKFTVAVDRSFKSKDTAERQADFIRVTAWRATAEFVSKYFSKGKMIIVEGSLRNNDYTDKDGVKHYSMDVQADKVSFGGSKSDDNGGATVQAKHEAVSEVVQEALSDSDLSDFGEIISDDSEIPF